MKRTWPLDRGLVLARIESDRESVAKLFLLGKDGGGLADVGGSGEDRRGVVSALRPLECGFGGGDMPPSLLRGRWLMFSFDSVRKCDVPFWYTGGLSGAAFCVTGLKTLLLSLLPMPDRQSSSRIFFGETSIFGVDCWICSACSRCSHFANAAFFFTGDSDRSLFPLGRVTKGSLAES